MADVEAPPRSGTEARASAPATPPGVPVAVLCGNRLDVGGVESALLSLFRHGAASAYRWVVAARASDGFAARARALGADCVEWSPRHALDLRSLPPLLRLLEERSVGLVHLQDARASILGRAAARLLSVPTVTTVQLPSYYPVLGRHFAARARRRAYQAAERLLNRVWPGPLLYASARVRREAVALGVAPRGLTRVIENGVEIGDAPGDPELRAALGPPGSLILGSAGRLDDQKGLDVLLDALRLLGPKPDWSLWLAGDGPRRADLEARAARAGLSDRVRFLGFRGDVPALLRATDLFVLPSRYEAMPLALLEAMGAGVACVATPVGDNADLLGGAAGRLVPVDDAPALASALRALLENAEERARLGREARRRAAGFGADRMVERTLAVYDEVVGRR